VVSEPVAADHREADEEADELRAVVVELVGELVDAAGVAQGRDGEVDNQQGHRDREQPVGEGQCAGELDGVAAVCASRRELLLHSAAR
jgi:hypothetical protein